MPIFVTTLPNGYLTRCKEKRELLVRLADAARDYFLYDLDTQIRDLENPQPAPANATNFGSPLRGGYGYPPPVTDEDLINATWQRELLELSLAQMEAAEQADVSEKIPDSVQLAMKRATVLCVRPMVEEQLVHARAKEKRIQAELEQRDLEQRDIETNATQEASTVRTDTGGEAS